MLPVPMCISGILGGCSFVEKLELLATTDELIVQRFNQK
jgi:hypothetical protein